MRLVMLALVATMLAACGGPTERDNTLRIGVGLEPPNLDPTSSAAAAIDEIVYANVFEGLTRIVADGSVQPGLAQSWTVSEDGRVYTFTLREGVRFHDGTAFDAENVKFTLDRARADGSTNPRPDIFAVIETVTVLDPLTVQVTLNHAASGFLFNMALGDAVILAPQSAATNAVEPIGTGPFQFARWQKGQRVRLERFEGYWGEPAKLDAVEFLIIPDSAAAYAALLAGDVDGFPGFPAPELVGQLERNSRFKLQIGASEGETVMGLNADRAPFNDVRVRRAIGHGINRRAIIDGAMFGYGVEIGSFFSPLHPAYIDLTDQSAYDPDHARALLVEAGYPDGFTAELKLPPTAYARRSGEIIAAQLGEIGIEVSLEYVEWAQWLDQVLTRHSYDMTIVSHTEPNDLSFFARETNYFRYQNPDFNAVLDAIEYEGDTTRRTALYQDAQRMLADDGAAVFLFQLPMLGAWRGDVVGVWSNAPIQAIDVTGVYFTEPDRDETP